MIERQSPFTGFGEPVELLGIEEPRGSIGEEIDGKLEVDPSDALELPEPLGDPTPKGEACLMIISLNGNDELPCSAGPFPDIVRRDHSRGICRKERLIAGVELELRRSYSGENRHHGRTDEEGLPSRELCTSESF